MYAADQVNLIILFCLKYFKIMVMTQFVTIEDCVESSSRKTACINMYLEQDLKGT